MKINFGDSFLESLDKLQRYEAWHNRMWRAITGDLWYFFKNIWKFRKELWPHRWWDYTFTLMMLRKSIVIMEKDMHGGLEIHESRDKKIQKMQRVIAILDNITEHRYIEMAEAELGDIIHHGWDFEPVSDDSDLYTMIDKDTPEEALHNRKIYDRSNELEELEWQELWVIFQGQDTKKFNRDVDWYKQFDGTGLRGWWD